MNTEKRGERVENLENDLSSLFPKYDDGTRGNNEVEFEVRGRDFAWHKKQLQGQIGKVLRGELKSAATFEKEVTRHLGAMDKLILQGKGGVNAVNDMHLLNTKIQEAREVLINA